MLVINALQIVALHVYTLLLNKKSNYSIMGLLQYTFPTSGIFGT